MVAGFKSHFNRIHWQHGLLIPFLFLIVALLVRLPNFNESLWWDETCYTFMELSSEAIGRLLYHDVHPPFYTVFMLGWVHLFGDSTIAVRIPSLIFGLSSLAVLFTLTKEWFNKKIAFLATLLMTLSPVHIWYSQENKNNMLLLLLSLLTVYSVQKAWADNRWRNWVFFIIIAILSLWTNHYSLWVVISVFLWLWFQILSKQGRGYLKQTITSSIIVYLAYMPFALTTLFQVNIDKWSYLRPFTISEIYKLFFIYLSHGNTIRTIFPWAPFQILISQPWIFFIVELFFCLLLGCGLFIVGHGWLMKRRGQPAGTSWIKPGSELLFLYFLLPPIFLLLASLFNSHIYIERSMIILLPPFIMLIANGTMAFRRRKWRYTAICILIFINCFALFNLWVSKSDKWTVWMPNPDWRSAARYFDNQLANSSDQFIIAQITPSRTLNYYYTRLFKLKNDEDAKAYPSQLSIIDFNKDSRVDLLKSMSNGIETFYLIHNRLWSGNFHYIIKKIKRNRKFGFENKISFKGLDIYKFHLFHFE